ncbi:ComEC/Rec2 family competence protein [Paenibacillus sp. MWE-103]|uniref:ComEC/Rec2 family competence protein n=1 Tax=Paenibacillus artemisiicola TaxID=1172618 RepID=A0ABS3WDT0_9BACL|nr:ComEC/Rec2 family competence protein [Paenibacillus artemisiicola]MBO7746506.1 ComEC/Rec2 family competence protein [Paenibacillus artemisiicola]
MTARPLVWFTVCWVLGSSAAAGMPARGVALAGAALLAALAALALTRRSSWPLAAACLAAYGLAAGQRSWADARNIAALPAQYAAALAASPADAAEFAAELAGTIASPPEIDGDRVQFRVSGGRLTLQDGGASAPVALGGERLLVQVKLAEEQELSVAAGWRRGQRVSVAGMLSVPSAGSNFGGFDYRAYLHGQRIHWLLGADGAAAVRTAPGPRWSAAALLEPIDALRASLGRRMDALYPGVQAGYMKGLVLGISDDLDPDMFQRFSQLGLTHILAISGLHVAVFLYVLGGLLRLLRMTRERMLLILIAAVPFYVFLAGASPSVVRSGIMAMLGLAAARLHKLKDGLHLLAAAALLMLVWDPYMLGNVGFQLSFLVTAGLMLGTAPVRGLLPRGRKWWSKSLCDLLAVTVVAQAVSLPLTIYYFNQLHVLSVAANLVLVPFISFVVMPLGGASLVLDGLWHPAGALAAAIAAVGNDLTFGFVLKLSGLNRFRLIWATPPLWWVALFYAALALAFRALGRLQAAKRAEEEAEFGTPEAADAGSVPPGSPLPPARHTGDEPTQPLRGASPVPAGEDVWSAPFIRLPATSPGLLMRNRVLLGLAAASLAGLALFAYCPDALDRHGYVEFLDVGQGDSIYIRTPGGKHMLIDGGGAVEFGSREPWRQRKDPFEVGRKVVVPLLQQRGVHALDLLVLSHLDSDHIKGLLAVMASIPVRAVLWNGSVKDSPDAVALLREAVDAGIPLYRAEGGRGWDLDPHASIRIVGSPPVLLEAGKEAGAVPEADEQNGESVALLLDLYGRRFLFAGDADAAEERSLLAQLQEQAPTSPLSSAPVDVMKISHHGSKTSTTDDWLAYWHPAQAVISVGRNNLYGHPHPTVVERLREAGIPAARTDLNGEVQFRIDPAGSLSKRTVLAARP